MHRFRWAVTLGVVTGLVGVIVSAAPSVGALEDDLALRWLFQFRGSVTPPANVAVVSLDEAAAVRMDLPMSPRDWPRSLHARLIERLVQLGAAAIVFDMQFVRQSESPSEDEAFAHAMARAGRVALVQRLEVAHVNQQTAWEQQDPIPPLSASAAALAPAPVPSGLPISWSWAFLETPNRGEVPSLSAVALQLYALPVTDRFVDELRRSGTRGLDSLPRPASAIRTSADLLELMQGLRRVAVGNRAFFPRLLASSEPEHGESVATHATHLALAALYGGEASAYLNFYGPPGTICTVPYDLVLQAPSGTQVPCALRGAVVLVGFGSGRMTRAGQPDTHHTVYGSGDGATFSGVEIHATSVANLLTRRTLRQPGPGASVALLVLMGSVVGAAGLLVRTRGRRFRSSVTARLEAIAVLTAIGGAYTVMTYLSFREAQLLLPIVVPLLFQFPTALVLGLLVPPVQYQEQSRAVCLITDAAGSTAVGQQTPHRDYARLMNEYNEALSRPARAHGGEVLPPQGDGFVCLWCLPDDLSMSPDADAATRQKACEAALDISRASEEFNRSRPQGQRLATRIGLTVGPVTLFFNTDRGLFEALGDPINLASRVRDLNVAAGTSILAAEAVIEGLDGVVDAQPVHIASPLKGVDHPVAVYEIRSAVPTS